MGVYALKVCRFCKEEKPADCFFNNGRFVRSECADCYKKARREYYYDNKSLYKDRQLKNRYGLKYEDYLELLLAQNGVCAICKRGKEENSAQRNLAVDHCHETNKIRGLLCNKCNQGLGLLKHDANTLENAVAYLKR